VYVDNVDRRMRFVPVCLGIRGHQSLTQGEKRLAGKTATSRQEPERPRVYCKSRQTSNVRNKRARQTVGRGREGSSKSLCLPVGCK
jgi:hypothetical protein